MRIIRQRKNYRMQNGMARWFVAAMYVETTCRFHENRLGDFIGYIAIGMGTMESA